ncbi:MAG: hypothetical protein ABL890_04535 [Candidatus Peribacteraceae bacterium]
MSTTKKRLNITLSDHLAVFLKKVALRDEVPQATKAAEMLERAMELEEDAYFSMLAEEREKKTSKLLSHDDFWSKAL